MLGRFLPTIVLPLWVQALVIVRVLHQAGFELFHKKRARLQFVLDSDWEQ